MSAFPLGIFATLDELECQLLWPLEIWGWEKSPDGGCHRLHPQCKGELQRTLSFPHTTTLPTHLPIYLFVRHTPTKKTTRHKASKQTKAQNMTYLLRALSTNE